MNIVYIHTHDTGRLCPPYRDDLPAPNLRRLAGESLVFSSAFCAGPTCSPSRASLLTGMRAFNSGVYGLTHRGFSLDDPRKHMASFFARNGFDTALFGVQHEASDPRTLGYSVIHALSGPKEESDPANAGAAAEYIASRRGDTPFFLSFGMNNTHRVFPDAGGEGYAPPPEVADTPDNCRDMAGFAKSLSVADQCLGVVYDSLRQSGRLDDTAVVFTTDHGPAFPRMKCHLYDGGIGVALMLRLPGEAGRVIHSLVSHIDLYPTLCGLTGLEVPDWAQGVSLLPLVSGQKDSVRDEVFGEVTYHAAYEPQRSVRTRRYKYIKYYDDYGLPVAANTDESPAKHALRDAGYYNSPRPSELFFDLQNDPGERVNLISSPDFAGPLKDLRQRLSRWMETTGDPLFTHPGRVPAPKGARINLRSSFNPASAEYETEWR